MPRTSENLVKHELIGLKAKVVSSPDNSQEDVKGEVLNETRNTLTIGGKQVPKNGRIFQFYLDDEQVKVEGEDILARPEDRLR